LFVTTSAGLGNPCPVCDRFRFTDHLPYAEDDDGDVPHDEFMDG
jgi:hypothetical protein